jgi:predicted glycoside hydrolase/deacetylase ChbG (UPF0249 family)
MRTLVLCADDFGLSPGVSRGIADLAHAGRLSAVSCMAASPDFVISAPLLKGLERNCDIGLHITLTALDPLGPMPKLAPDGRLPSLGVLMRRLLLAPPLAEILDELRRQLARFASAFGRAPDFVDGHQHVHILPGVRQALLRLFESGELDSRTYVRDCYEPAARVVGRGVAVPRALLISFLARPLHAELRRRALRRNRGFSGINDFAERRDFGALFRRFLRGTGPQPLVMCHPGHPDEAIRGRDPIVARRADEQAYFAGETFPADLDAAGFHLGRLG